MIIYKTEGEIEKEISEQLGTLGIFDMWSSPVLTSIFSPFVGEITNIHAMIQELDLQTRLATATGTYLEHRAMETAGITRISLLPPEDLTYTNFHFYIANDKTAGEITVDGNGFTIPAGTIVSDGTYNFETLDDAVFEPTSKTVYVRIRAINPNTPLILENTLVEVDLDLSTIPNIDTSNKDAVILATNDKPIIPTTFNENDEELRYRALQAIAGRSGINEATLRARLREIGVVDYITHEDFYGVGKAGIEIITNNPVVPEPLIIQANEIVKSIYPGNRVIRPYYLMVAFVIDLEVIDPAGLETTQSAIKAAIIDEMNTYRLGTMLNIIKLNNIISNIDNVKSASISCIFIDGYKSTLTNQRCQPDEKFVLDINSRRDNITFAIRQ